MTFKESKIKIIALSLSLIASVLLLTNYLWVYCWQGQYPCDSIFWCRSQARDYCDDFCEFHNGCRRVHCEEQYCGQGDCVCWSWWIIYCNDGAYEEGWECGEYDPYFCGDEPMK